MSEKVEDCPGPKSFLLHAQPLLWATPEGSLNQKTPIDKSDQRENYGERQTGEFLWLD